MALPPHQARVAATAGKRARYVPTSVRWTALKEIFHHALDLQAEHRPRFVAEACAGDERLKAEMISLLAAHDAAGDLLEVPAAPPGDRLPPGLRLGRYEVKGLLGAGGMGEVYRARDTRLKRDVAVKVLPSGAPADRQRLRLFEREAVAASALNHPNIVTVHDAGTYAARPYLTMELLPGQTLRQRLAAGLLPLPAVLHLAWQVADGLAAAHAAGIVHRDLKPENIMVTEDGRAKILDFGVAKLDALPPPEPGGSVPPASAASSTGVVGTLAYMSPEQARGAPVDARSDQFSLGVILREMVTGRRAQASDTADLLATDGRRALELPASVPGELRAIITRCLSGQVEGRYSSTRTLALALLAIQSPTPPARRTRPYARWLAVAATLVIGAGSASRSFPRRPISGAVLPSPSLSADRERPYLKGRYFANKRTGPDLERAVAAFNEALAHDPDHAPALAGLAEAYVLLSDYAGHPSTEMLAKAKEAALRAVKADDRLSEAHSSLAVVRKSYDRDWRAAEQEFRRAIELDPRNVTAHHWYGILLGSLGRFDAGLAELRVAEQLDPLSLGVTIGLGQLFHWAGRQGEALAQTARVLELYPGFVAALELRGLSYLAQGRTEQALGVLREARRLAPDCAQAAAILAYAQATAGHLTEARSLLRELEARRRERYVSPTDMAALRGAVGDDDGALTELEDGYRMRSGDLADLRVDPRLARLRRQPRFQRLLRRVTSSR
jgi:serine/threonine protein kinase/Flp pilus assembly protein TadD